MSDLVIAIINGPQASTKVVSLTGEMDEPSLQQIHLNIDPVLDDLSVTRVIFNLADLQYINSKGIGYLVAVHSHLAKNQRKLVLVAANEPVMDVMSLVGLTSIIPHFENLEEALAA